MTFVITIFVAILAFLILLPLALSVGNKIAKGFKDLDMSQEEWDEIDRELEEDEEN